MVKNTEDRALLLTGEHTIPVSRERLWRSLNDPETLQACIKGCQHVARIDEQNFEATFRFCVGPLKRLFKAQLQVQNADLPENYCLAVFMNAGVAGKINGVAEVALDAIDGENTKLSYTARIHATGWLGELGFMILGNKAERYMKGFFDNLIKAIGNFERG